MMNVPHAARAVPFGGPTGVGQAYAPNLGTGRSAAMSSFIVAARLAPASRFSGAACRGWAVFGDGPGGPDNRGRPSCVAHQLREPNDDRTGAAGSVRRRFGRTK